MPSIIAHGIMGYLLNNNKIGIIYSILPDIIGYTRYIIKLLYNYYLNGIPENYFDRLVSLASGVPKDKFDSIDKLLYKISHSIVIWLLLYIFTNNKYIKSTIFSILLDILLHSDDYWMGPEFLYPLSNITYNGIHWNTFLGNIIQFFIIIILYQFNYINYNF